jgi:hypothetical protein
MSIAPTWQQCLAFFGTELVIEPLPAQLFGDAGLLPIRPFDPYIGLTRAFAEARDDPRDSDLTEHTFPEILRARGDDTKGVQARLQTYPQDHFRHHLGCRDFTTCCCAQSEWDEMERAQPGHHKLIQAVITNEGEAERLARGTAGAPPVRR